VNGRPFASTFVASSASSMSYSVETLRFSSAICESFELSAQGTSAKCAYDGELNVRVAVHAVAVVIDILDPCCVVL
jgi:hypothetical protein